MRTDAINNVNFEAKFVKQVPRISDARILDGHKLLIKIPENCRKMFVETSKEVKSLKNGVLTERIHVNYGNPQKECFVLREVVNAIDNGTEIAYKKITRLSKDKVGFHYLIQRLNDGVYYSMNTACKNFGFDFKQDKLPKSVLGLDKYEQKTFYTEQPKFFKKMYIKSLSRLITDKNGCEKTDSKLFEKISQIIDNNAQKNLVKMF